jgi:hypothetical protein
MGKRLLRGRFEKRWARGLVRTLERVDGVLLTLAPLLRNWCGEKLWSRPGVSNEGLADWLVTRKRACRS